MSLNGSISHDYTAAVKTTHAIPALPKEIEAGNAALATQAAPMIPVFKTKRSGSRVEILKASTELRLLQDAGEATKDRISNKKK